MMLKRYLTYWLYLYIRGMGCEDVYVLRVRGSGTRTHAPRTGTAANVGATRARSAVEPLASIPFKIFLTPAPFCKARDIFVARASFGTLPTLRQPNAPLCNTSHYPHHPYEMRERAALFDTWRYGVYY